MRSSDQKAGAGHHHGHGHGHADEEKEEVERPATFAPFISAGAISVADLKKLVLTMEEEGAKKVKLTGEIIFVWDHKKHLTGLEEKTGYKANVFKEGGVRPVKMCSAETFCQRFVRPVLGLAMRLDRLYYRSPLPVKLAIGVAGCIRSCSEPATKDVGIIGHPKGYELLAGGSAGAKPVVARKLAIVPTEDDVITVVGRVIEFVRAHGKKGMRLNGVIEKVGFEEFRREILHGVATVVVPGQGD